MAGPAHEAATGGLVVASPSQPRRSRGKAPRDPSPDISAEGEDESDEGTDVDTYLNQAMFGTQVYSKFLTFD